MSQTLEARTVRGTATEPTRHVIIGMSDLQLERGAMHPAVLKTPGSLSWAEKAFADLLKLPANWDSYGAERVDPRIAESALDFLESLANHLPLRRPELHPTRSGGVLITWRAGSAELEVELLSPDAGSFVFEDSSSGEEAEDQLSRAVPVARSPLWGFLLRVAAR